MVPVVAKISFMVSEPTSNIDLGGRSHPDRSWRLPALFPTGASHWVAGRHHRHSPLIHGYRPLSSVTLFQKVGRVALAMHVRAHAQLRPERGAI